MKAITYFDDNGNEIYSVLSPIPGMTFVPPGKKIGDGVEITAKEFAAKVKKVDDDNAKKPKPRDLIAELDAVTAELTALKANVDRLKKP